MNRDSDEALPLVELDTLRTLVAIADTGNFSAAADVVFRTPSAVSMQVKKTEAMLGRPLFIRDSRSVVATPDGERLVQHGKRMLALNREVMATFVSPDVVGVVRLGAPDDMIEHTLPDLLCRFAHTHAGITVDVVVDSSTHLRQKVRDGELDLAMVTCAPDTQSAKMSAHISGQRAAILADLAIAPIPVSACVNGIVPLGAKQGLPTLGNYALGMILAEQISKPAAAAADHLRACFAAHKPPALSIAGGAQAV